MCEGEGGVRKSGSESGGAGCEEGGRRRRRRRKGGVGSLFCPNRFERSVGNRGAAAPPRRSGLGRLRCCGLTGGGCGPARSALGFYFILCVYVYTRTYVFPSRLCREFPSALPCSSPREMGGCCPHQWVNPWRKYANPPLCSCYLHARLHPPGCTRALHNAHLLSPAGPPPTRSVTQPAPSHWGHTASARLGCFVFEAAAAPESRRTAACSVLLGAEVGR